MVESNYDVKITSKVEVELKQLDVDPLFCENALKILEKRYLVKDDDGEVAETPKDMLARVAANIAYADMLYGAGYDGMYDFAKTLYTTMSNLELLPNSPTLRGAGRETQQLSACFVIPIADSRKSIFGALMEAVDIQAFGGGTGFNFSHIRPRGSKVQSTGGEASGPISFMQIFDIAVGKVIAQGGVRQGANMGILSYDHPDIMQFIDSKLDGKTLSNFNISIGVTEEFMEMVAEGMEYELIDPSTNGVVGRLNAREVMDKIAQNAWQTGDPGLIFLDRINRENPTPHIGVIESTNPCIDGDTLVAVADGRDAVSIRQLAEEGADVPVYCSDDNGHVVIGMMRNPRLTGRNKKILRVSLDDGSSIRTTENHKFILSDGTVVEAVNLASGDSLSIMQRTAATFDEVVNSSNSSNSRSQEYSWIRSTNRTNWKPEHRIIVENNIGRKLKRGEVVHHKNYCGLDNSIDNLQVMAKEEHNRLHTANMLGDNNPMRRFPEKNWMNDPDKQRRHRELHHIGKKRSQETRDRISKATKLRVKDPEYRTKVSIATKKGMKLHRDKFMAYIKNRAEKKLADCQSSTDLVCYLDNNCVMVKKICEGCGVPFSVSWSRREISFHSHPCYLSYHNSSSEIRDKILASTAESYSRNMAEVRSKQVECYRKMAADVGRGPLLIEYRARCKEEGLSCRFGTKYGFASYADLKTNAAIVNHKVVSVEPDGYEDVYNGTVEEFHNMYIGGFDSYEDGKNISSFAGCQQCGEQPLLPYESCNLASINLVRMLKKTQSARHEAEIPGLESGVSRLEFYEVDYEKLARTVRISVHLLDNVIDMNRYPLEKIEEMTKGNRKIGLGVMGWADVLARMGIPYDSDEAVELAETVMEFINTNAKSASVELAETRGVFPNFKGSIYDTGEKDDMVRNASWTTIAPTGTLSILADCNGGIEPFFMIVYSRGSIYDAEGKPTVELLIENETFKRVALERGFYSEELSKKIAETGSLQHIDGIPNDVRRAFVTSHDISYEWHLKMQSAFQEHLTNAVSKTINFPNDATVDDIRKSYRLAYELNNVKGITVYRDGCKEYQVLSAQESKPVDEETIIDRSEASRPRRVIGVTERIETPVGTLFVTINSAEGKLYEVFLNIGKAGADVTADAEGYGRLLSMIFKAGLPPQNVIKQLRGIGGSSSIGFGKKRVRSLPDAIARVLELYLEEMPSETYEIAAATVQEPNMTAPEPKMSGDMCPDCGNMLVFEESCSKCKNCGYSRC